MGGIGSGNHNRIHGDSVDEHRRIDVFRMYRDNILRDGWSGRWQWTSSTGATNYIHLKGARDHIELNYRWRIGDGPWSPVSEQVAIDWVACHYGGHRPMYICPGCQKRARYLYGAGQYFRCQRCHDLVHGASRLGRLDRKIRRVNRLRRKLGAEEALEAPLPKPPNMHEATWEALVEDICDREAEVFADLFGKLKSIERKIGPASRSATARGFWS